MIQNYTKCERCEHNKVCSYKEIQKDVMSKMEGRLDNACSPEIFKFSFECKEYKAIETTIKNNPFA
jgi:hypothetical protein